MRKLALTLTIAGALALVACQDRRRQQTEPGQGGTGMQEQPTYPGSEQEGYQQRPGEGTGGTGVTDDIEQRQQQQDVQPGEGMGGQEGVGGEDFQR